MTSPNRPPLQERMRCNATLLRMMTSGELALERRSLAALAADLDAWAREMDSAEICAAVEKERRAA